MIRSTKSTLKKSFLEMMVCPLTKEKLVYSKNNNELISKKANLAYPIKNGIPVLIISEARKL